MAVQIDGPAPRRGSADRALFHALPLPATLIDRAGVILDVNPAFLAYARSLGLMLTAADRIGQPITAFAHGGVEHRRFVAFIDRTLAGGGPCRVCLRQGLPGEQDRYVCLHGNTLFDADGQVTGGIIVREDISRRVALQTRLRSARHRERNLAGVILTIAGIRDLDLLLSTVVQQAVRLTGATRGVLFLRGQDPERLEPRAHVGCDPAALAPVRPGAIDTDALGPATLAAAVGRGTVCYGLLAVAPEPRSAGDHLDILNLLADQVGMALELDERTRALQRSHAELQRREQRYRALFELANDAFLVYTRAETRILDANAAACSLLGYTRQELLRLVASRDIITPECRDSTDASRNRQLDASDHFFLQTEWRHRDGRYLPLDVSGALLDLEGAQVVLVMARDASERLAGTRLQREFARRTIDLQEQERLRVARELHDGVGQILADVRGHLVGEEATGARDHIQTAGRRLDQALDEIRRICHNLRPSALDDLGLLAALRGLAGRLRASSGVDIVVTGGSPVGALPDALETHLYRIAQEALTNVVHHAHAHLATLSLADRDGSVELTVTDDGDGFDPDAVDPAGGHGLHNMRERAALIGAEFGLETAPGQGTTVRLRLRRSAPGPSGP